MSIIGRWIESTIGPPSDGAGDWITVPYQIGDRRILLARPRDPDRFLDDPSVLTASKVNDYMPYWTYVWPGAMLLAEYVLGRQWQGNREAIEIGCGLGLAGLASLAAGMHVTFSDYSPAAIATAMYNARLNGFERFATRLVDWQRPPSEQFGLILGADVLYEARCLPDVIRVLDGMLAERGEALLADPDRRIANDFDRLARQRGYDVRCQRAAARTESARVITGRVFIVRRRSIS